METLQVLDQWIGENFVCIIIGLVSLTVLLLILVVALLVSNHSLKKRVNRFLGARSERHNLEAILSEYLGKVDSANKKFDGIMASLDNINHRLSFSVQKVGIVRYNPFDNKGSDLSFALALLDDHNNGVVINTIHGRDASYTYAKPILSAQSSYVLSDEEIEAIELAMEKGDKQMEQYFSKL